MQSDFKTTLGLLSLSLLFLVGCAETPPRQQVRFQQDSFVWVGTSAHPLTKRKGDRMEVESLPLLIEAPGHAGLLVLPSPGLPGTIDVSLTPLDSKPGSCQVTQMAAPESSAAPSPTGPVDLNALMTSINEVQLLLRQRHSSQALAKLEVLQKKYPSATYLGFLRVSCLLAEGEKRLAREALATMLKQFPQDATGNQLSEEMGWSRESLGLSPRMPASTPHHGPGKGDE